MGGTLLWKESPVDNQQEDHKHKNDKNEKSLEVGPRIHKEGIIDTVSLFVSLFCHALECTATCVLIWELI